MAVNGVNKSGGAVSWSVGLVNYQGKYFTAETFGFKINAAGTTMRKKQVWTIEHDANEDDVIYIRSHLGRYLAADKRGNVTCESESKGADEKFSIQYNPDGSGRWGIISKSFGSYFGGTDDNLQCKDKVAKDAEWWTIRLSIHPQVNLRNVNRQKYACLSEASDHIQFKKVVPWGQEATIMMEFINGKYALRPCNNMFLHREGHLVEACGDDTLFTLELVSGQYSGMALKDCSGRYLTAVGMEANMQGRNKTVTKDEVFTLEDSHPQVFFTAHNGKKVSIKQGIDLSANQDDDEVSDRETFQIEFDKKSGKWRMRTAENKFWSLEAANGIQGVGNQASGTGLFSIEWQDDGAVALKASNDKYVTAKMNGSLYAVSDSCGDKERMILTVINRPILILKCDFGFIGFKSASNARIECNKASHDVIYLEHNSGRSGAYHLKGRNGKYYSVDEEGHINSDSAKPEPFILQLRGQSKVVIKAPNGCFLKGEQNGIVTAKQADAEKATLWEY